MKEKQTVQEKYNAFLSKLLKEKLFEPAMEVNAILVKTFNVTSQYARKILERAVAQKAIKSSAPHTFGKGQYVYIYNEYDFGKDGVKKITEKSRPPIYRLLELMDQNKGIISYYEALKITSAPLEESSTKVVSLDDILTLLMKLDIVHKVTDRNDLVYIVYKIYKDKEAVVDAMMADHFAAMVADCSVLPDILRWLGNANIIDSGNAIYRNKKTPHIEGKAQ